MVVLTPQVKTLGLVVVAEQVREVQMELALIQETVGQEHHLALLALALAGLVVAAVGHLDRARRLGQPRTGAAQEKRLVLLETETLELRTQVAVVEAVEVLAPLNLEATAAQA
jgi:aspartokinase-like uncharacterized kinase